MSNSDRGKLGSFLREVIDWNWSEFCKAELDADLSGLQGAVLSLVRRCSDGKLGAIQLAIDRVDGKVETPIKVEYPKVFILFPDAKSVALAPPDPSSPTAALVAPEDFNPLSEEPAEPEEEKVHLATMSLRETLRKMADTPRKVPLMIHQRKKEVENAIAKNQPLPEEKNIPLVKSVIAANLLTLAESGKFEAITEVFDQIDGKLVETIRILGEDMYITSYILEAPYGAKKNKDGVYYLEAPQISDTWKAKFKKD
jgi:hypothetical protein